MKNFIKQNMLLVLLLTSAIILILLVLILFKPNPQKNEVTSESIENIINITSEDNMITSHDDSYINSLEASDLSALSNSSISKPSNNESTDQKNICDETDSMETLATDSIRNETELTEAIDSDKICNETNTMESTSTDNKPNEITQIVNPSSDFISDELSYDKMNFYYKELDSSIINRIYGVSYKKDCTVPYKDLRYVSILYYDFNGNIQKGEIICNKSIAQDFIEIFKALYDAKYPLERVRLVDEYDADDTLSMIDNNTSCFNYRTVDGTTNMSKHALGLAIDVNPFYNPYIKTNSDGTLYISPPGSEPYADRSSDNPYMIDENDLCYKLFKSHGFKWGGHYKTLKDYQHFYKDK